MKDRKLAVRYARALLASLPDLEAAARAGEFLSGLVEAVEASPELKDAFLNPAFGRGRRKDILRALGAGRDVPSQVSSFLQVVADNNRLAALPRMIERGVGHRFVPVLPCTLVVPLLRLLPTGLLAPKPRRK